MSGLFNYIVDLKIKVVFVFEMKCEWLVEQLFDFIYVCIKYFVEFDEIWSYSNVNYVLFGKIIEQVMGEYLNVVI